MSQQDANPLLQGLSGDFAALGPSVQNYAMSGQVPMPPAWPAGPMPMGVSVTAQGNQMPADGIMPPPTITLSDADVERIAQAVVRLLKAQET